MSPLSSKSGKDTNCEPIRVLVVGDWVVDENWVLARHRSSTSTMEGQSHLRALGNMGSRVMTFCGAGRVARFLYWMNRFKELKDGGGPPAGWVPRDERTGMTFDVHGLGTWAEEDEPKLYKMFYPRYPDGINPFTLTRVMPREGQHGDQSTQMPHTLTRYVLHDHLDGLHLCNLAPAYRPEEPDWKDVGTTRVYRLYNIQAESPGGLVLDRRVDFELRYSSNSEKDGRNYDEIQLNEALSTWRGISEVEIWVNNSCKALSRLRRQLSIEAGPEVTGLGEAFNAIDTTLRNLSNPIDSQRGNGPAHAPGLPFQYVVIKDLGKGTVTGQLIQSLGEQKLIGDQTQWFISSKQHKPPYLSLFEPQHHHHLGKIRLLFLPPMAIAQLAQDAESFVNHWFIDEKEPSREGISKLEKFHTSYHGRHKTQNPTLVVAMPKGLSILAVEDQEGELIGYAHPKPILNEIDEELTGRASMFFAALTAQLIREDRESSHGEETQSEGRCQMIEVALKASYDLVRGNINALRSFGSKARDRQTQDLFSFDPSFKRYGRSASAGQNSPVQQMEPFNWATKNSEWLQATSNTGIIKINDNPPKFVLELWRAMGEFDGYVETVEERRRSITELISALHGFLRSTPKSSFSAMLIAKPGTGKSHLVTRIAAELRMPSLSFNITELQTRERISECFDQIASAQARDRNRLQLVFFDEINTKFAAGPVYDLFLTVLENGTYRRGSQSFKLDPCAWLFAGTKELDDAATETKEADFKSRLNMEAVKLQARGGDSDERRALIYQGALQLQDQHKDVKKISAQVLKAFASLELNPDKGNSRKIWQLASRFRNIQYGEVREKNLPEELSKALVLRGNTARDDFQPLLGNTPQTSDELDKILVEIRRRPEKDEYGDSVAIPEGDPL